MNTNYPAKQILQTPDELTKNLIKGVGL